MLIGNTNVNLLCVKAQFDEIVMRCAGSSWSMALFVVLFTLLQQTSLSKMNVISSFFIKCRAK